MDFDDDFARLTGNPAFPWQRALYERFVAGDFPRACDLPTGLGKTSVIVLWLLALAQNPKLPRRLVYVVNRRTVVDQATTEAERLAQCLNEPHAAHLRAALAALVAVPLAAGDAPLAISTLRGQRADNAEWRRDPSRPAVVIGTVEMVGSRLLFQGYGCGFRSQPLHAGFLGHDALLVHDEAHLEPAFQQLLGAIRDEQNACREPRPLRVMALSATGREHADFTLSDADAAHEVVARRIRAKKRLRLHTVDDRKELPDRIAARAAELEGRVVVFLSSVEHAEKCAKSLQKLRGKDRVQVLTGTMRGAERDQLVTTPVFARFLPRPPPDLKLQDGTVYLVATSAGEVGIDISGDHLVTDLPPFDALAQRLGRVNRYGEGDAEVDVYCEKLKEPPKEKESGDADDDDEPAPRRRDEYDYARYATRALLGALPELPDERRDASPAALRALPADERAAASTPAPDLRSVDAILFDRWSFTSVTGKLPGRPPVGEWLHGLAEWEPPRTTVAWRREVRWLSQEQLGEDSLDEFLADYPLRARETLSDRTDRVVKHLEAIAARDVDQALRVWLVRHGEPARVLALAELLEQYDAKRNPVLHDATVVLPPDAGGLNRGLLDGDVEFATGQEALYDLGPAPDERAVHEFDESVDAPEGMRLVRSIRREDDEGNTLYWHLYATARRADDEGSRSSRRRQPLDEHLRRTEHWARLLAERLGLPPAQARALSRAGLWHDLGKRRRVWQRSIKNYGEPPLAKGPMQPADLGHYRHELGSLHDALNEAGFSELTEEERELALHVIAAHHGRARPHFPERESYDPEVRDEAVGVLVREVPLRFERLQRRYGRWGLAWLESVLRAADVLASEDEEEQS